MTSEDERVVLGAIVAGVAALLWSGDPAIALLTSCAVLALF